MSDPLPPAVLAAVAEFRGIENITLDDIKRIADGLDASLNPDSRILADGGAWSSSLEERRIVF